MGWSFPMLDSSSEEEQEVFFFPSVILKVKTVGEIDSIHQNYFYYENIHQELQIIWVAIASLFSLTLVGIFFSTPFLYPLPEYSFFSADTEK